MLGDRGGEEDCRRVRWKGGGRVEIAEDHLFDADCAVFLRVEHAETELKPGFEFAKAKEAGGGLRLQLIGGLRGGMKYVERGEELGEVNLVVLDSTSATQTAGKRHELCCRRRKQR